jgi:hypothetical protein
LFCLHSIEGFPASLWKNSNNCLQVFIAVVVAFIIYKIRSNLLWNTIKILPRHGCISINQLFTSAIENNFAGKQSTLLFTQSKQTLRGRDVKKEPNAVKGAQSLNR